jgi:hypothetical protein
LPNAAPACKRFAGIPAHVGGQWNNGVGAGLFCANLNNAASNANLNIGGRLAKSTGGRVLTGTRTAYPLASGFLPPEGENSTTAGAVSRSCRTRPRRLQSGWGYRRMSAGLGISALVPACFASILTILPPTCASISAAASQKVPETGFSRELGQRTLWRRDSFPRKGKTAPQPGR